MSETQRQAPDNRIPLGSTDLRVSPLGIGTWAWGDKLFWDYGGSHNDSDLQQAFEVSLEQGINFFDTAEVYGLGRSEQLLGRFLPASQTPVVMASKFMPYPWRFSARSLVDALKASLKRTGLKQIDLYQIHMPLPPMAIEVWADALADAVDANLTRAVGVSNYSTDQMRRTHAALAKRGIPLASNQVQYSLLCRDPERNDLLNTCQQLGITLIAYSPLGMGLLTGKYTPTSPPKGPRGMGATQRLTQIQPLVRLLQDIGTVYCKTPAQVALNWVICKGALPIPGAKNAQQAKENAGALGWRLSNDEVAALDAVSLTF